MTFSLRTEPPKPSMSSGLPLRGRRYIFRDVQLRDVGQLTFWGMRQVIFAALRYPRVLVNLSVMVIRQRHSWPEHIEIDPS
jgi:hypothetical protein